MARPPELPRLDLVDRQRSDRERLNAVDGLARCPALFDRGLRDRAAEQREARIGTPAKVKPLQSQPSTKPTQQPTNDQPTDTGLLSTAAVSQQSAGPSQQDLDAADESLMKLNSRSQAVHASLESLRARQAAQGLSPSADITSGANRMDNYLGAAQRALQARDLENANKNMQRAEDELNKLEQKFGR